MKLACFDANQCVTASQLRHFGTDEMRQSFDRVLELRCGRGGLGATAAVHLAASKWLSMDRGCVYYSARLQWLYGQFHLTARPGAATHQLAA